ncbi:MAG TPA: histidine kinase, partial [Pseudomonas sp.]|nr:histidine kinase [Pseudomonas sp.]
MPSAPDSRTPDPIALEEAADWLIRLGEAELDQHERAQWERWKDSSPERQQAWARAQRLQS